VVGIWRTADGALTQRLEGHDKPVTSVAFSPDGALVASGSRDHSVRLWDVTDGEPLGTLQGHQEDVEAVAFSPDGETLASGSLDDRILVWDVSSGEEVGALEAGSNVTVLAFSPDGGVLASYTKDAIMLWSVPHASVVGTLVGHVDYVEAMDFSTDGKLLVTSSGDGTTRLWGVP
jgi:WD40 repeat protein